MCKFDKNKTYSAKDIAAELMKIKDYRDIDSATGSVNYIVKRLGIKAINGNRSNRRYSGIDSQNIYNYFAGNMPILINRNEPSEEVKTKDSIGGISVTTREELYRRSEIFEKKISEIVEEALVEYYANHPVSPYYTMTKEELINELTKRDRFSPLLHTKLDFGED